jgi:hypothetical protein
MSAPPPPPPPSNETILQRVLREAGFKASYEYQGKTFYDTVDVFDRHNFARDVKRNVPDTEWILEKTKYYLSETGIVGYAFRKDNEQKMRDKILDALSQPAAPLPQSPQAFPVPQSPQSFPVPQSPHSFPPIHQPQPMYYQSAFMPYGYHMQGIEQPVFNTQPH